MNTITDRYLWLTLLGLLFLWASSGQRYAFAQYSTNSIVDAPREIVEAVHGSAFVGSGSFLSNAPISDALGWSHEAWFQVQESIVNQTSGDVLRIFVDSTKIDPAAGFGPPPEKPGGELDAYWNSFKLVFGKSYHVVVTMTLSPEPHLMLRKLIPDDEWSLFRRDILDAKAGTYVWRDPVVIKEREWLAAAEESERLYQQMKSGSISRAAWKVAADRAMILFEEFKVLRGTNTAIYCN